MNVFEKILKHFFDSTQYLWYNLNWKFDADQKVIRISAIF
jgi:hypothetical protein